MDDTTVSAAKPREPLQAKRQPVDKPPRPTRAPSIIVGLIVAAVAGFVIILLAYLIKLRREEALLTREFGDEYLRFKQEVPALVPGLR